MLICAVKQSECSLSHVQLSVTPWTTVHTATLSVGFSRQKYWSGFPFPSRGDLPDPAIDPGIKHISPASPALASRFSTTEPPGKPRAM